jgi:Gpi18-like mannosyltransferase
MTKLSSIAARLMLIISVALVMRLPYTPHVGHSDDLYLNTLWGNSVSNQGLLELYFNVPSVNYAPVYMTMLGVAANLWQNTPYTVPLLKLFPVLSETLLIAAVTVWLSKEKILGWVLPLCLAIAPGLIATTALWGQSDAVLTLFLLLTIFAINRDQPLLAGGFYALAMLTSFQSIALMPLVAILILRRHGFNALVVSGLLFMLIMVAMLLPFILVSGGEAALRHYIITSDAPTTVNAFNIWYWITPPPSGDLWTIPNSPVFDNYPFEGIFTYRNIGLAMFSLYTLPIAISMWQQYKEKREFVWAAALYMGFFMLATKMHERYVYPAVIFSIVGIVQDRRLWFAALLLNFTYLYNIIYTLDVHLVWLGLPLLRLLPGTLLNAIILLNMTLLAEFARVQFPTTRIRLVNAGARAVAIVTFAAMLLLVFNPPRAELPPDTTATGLKLEPNLLLEGYHRGRDFLILYWRVTDEIPEGEYYLQFFTEENSELSLQLDAPLQVGNLPLHLSWRGRQLIASYPLPRTDQPLYISLYSTDGVWESEPILVR